MNDFTENWTGTKIPPSTTGLVPPLLEYLVTLKLLEMYPEETSKTLKIMEIEGLSRGRKPTVYASHINFKFKVAQSFTNFR